MPKRGAAATVATAEPKVVDDLEHVGPADADGPVILRRMLAVDPGDVHVGMAEFVETEDAWECIRAWETDPDSCADHVARLLSGKHLDLLIVEEWRLYPDKAMSQSYSELAVVQLIGVLKYLHRVHRIGFAKWREAGLAPGEVETELVMQPAGLKEATRGIIRTHGIESEAKKAGAGPHALDAEIHGWHKALRLMGAA